MDDRLQSCNPRAVSAIRNGKSPVCVARVMGVHLGTVYGWLARYRSGGWGMFEARKRGGRMTMAYDAKNQMTCVSNATWRVWNTYDHIGRRIQKRTQYPGAYGSTYEYKYLYDGWNMIAETINTAAPRHYLWGLDLSGVEQGAGGVGGLLGFTLGTNWFIPLYDATGNITGYVNASLGRPVINYEFDAYANLTTGNGISIFRCRFSTKHFDTETGLCYYGRRFYDPIWAAGSTATRSKNPAGSTSTPSTEIIPSNTSTRWAIRPSMFVLPVFGRTWELAPKKWRLTKLCCSIATSPGAESSSSR